MSAENDLRDAIIAQMDHVRTTATPLGRVVTFGDYADAIVALIKRWTAEEPA